MNELSSKQNEKRNELLTFTRTLARVFLLELVEGLVPQFFYKLKDIWFVVSFVGIPLFSFFLYRRSKDFRVVSHLNISPDEDEIGFDGVLCQVFFRL